MKAKQFFKQVDGAKSLCSECMDKEVQVQVRVNDEWIGEVKSIKIERIGHKFNPFATKKDGSLVLDLSIKL